MSAKMELRMPETIRGYRFGFQGQEKDDEITGNTGSHLAFKYRIHDARIGRFLSVDPLTKDYPHNSPYAFSENRVIDGVELEGLEYVYYTVKSIDDDGKCLLENTGVKDYKNWILNATGGLWGLSSFETPVVLYNGNGYLFSGMVELDVNVSDFTKDRWTEAGVDAMNTLLGIVGAGAQKAGKFSGNNVIDVVAKVSDNVEKVTTEIVIGKSKINTTQSSESKASQSTQSSESKESQSKQDSNNKNNRMYDKETM